MESRKVPAALALVGIVVAVVLFLVLDDDTADQDTTVATQPTNATENQSKPSGANEKPEKPDEPAIPRVEIEGGEPVGGVQELEFKSGDEARFEVLADAADELHFHGYDITVGLRPGKPKEVSFDAEIEGLFELESHSTGTLIAEISVVPR